MWKALLAQSLEKCSLPWVWLPLWEWVNQWEDIEHLALDIVPPTPTSHPLWQEQLLSHLSPLPSYFFFDCGIGVKKVKVDSSGQAWDQLTWYRLALIIWNWSINFLCRGRISGCTNFSWTASPTPRTWTYENCQIRPLCLAGSNLWELCHFVVCNFSHWFWTF